LMPFSPQFPPVTSHNPSHTFNIASFIGVESEHYGDHRQHSRVQRVSVYAINTPDFFIVLSLHPCCNMVNVSGGDFWSKTHNLILLRSLTRHFLH
jgi:hypothetical protein